jgi:hypothetical protein
MGTMELLLKRGPSSDKSTIGELSIDGKFECFILEDPVRPVKIPKITAIPAGRYEIVRTFSNRFQRILPLLLNVPNFDGVRMHPGNKAEDTDGCLLPGKAKSKDWVSQSDAAFKQLEAKIIAAINAGQRVFITIVNP